jgi:RimJ/RimL family protein N-acetyltransferase
LIIELQTERLLLRQWRAADRAPLAAMNADPRVMEHFPALQSTEQTEAMVDRFEQRLATVGHGHWAVEHAASGDFIGFTGLWSVPPGIELPASDPPALEIGWRLAAAHWGQGYASEAARAVLAAAYERIGLELVVSFTARSNLRSQAVMRRIGLRELGRFMHPRIDAASPVAPHVLYGLRREQFIEGKQA